MRSRDSAAAAARKYGIPAVAGDYRELLTSRDIDAVVITTPNDSHAAIACDAAKAGKHILVEKPMALDTASAETMVRAAEDGGVTLMVAQSRRFSDAVRELVRRLPEIGHPPGAYRLPCVVRPAAHGVVALLCPGRRPRHHAAGEPLARQHLLVARPDPAERLRDRGAHEPAWEGEDEADIVCRFSDGATATAHLSLSTSPGVHEALVVGRKGHLRLIERPAGPPFKNIYRLETNGEVLLDGLQSPSLYTHQLREFADAVRVEQIFAAGVVCDLQFLQDQVNVVAFEVVGLQAAPLGFDEPRIRMDLDHRPERVRGTGRGAVSGSAGGVGSKAAVERVLEPDLDAQR